MYLNPVCRLQCGRNPALFTGMKGKIIALLLIFGNLSAQEVEISSADALFQMALASNPAVRNAALQRDLAGITRKIAGVNAFSPRVPVSYQALDNIALQKTYVPGVIFGQPEGSYKELIMGQKYVATFNLSPQFDILNFSNRAQRRAAVVNEELAELSEKQAQRDIHLQINAAFHNVISFDRQKHILEENLEVARKIRTITGNRFEEGIARSQEVNEAEVNVVTLENSLVQLEENRRLQVELLKLLARPEGDLRIREETDTGPAPELRAEGSLEADLARTRTRMAGQDVRSARLDQWPVLSAVSSFNWQSLDNRFFYGSGSSAIYFAYVGLKLSWDLPTNVQKVSNLKNREVQWKIAENNRELAEEQQVYDNLRLETELRKAQLQLESLQKIETLKKDTFEKNFAQFEENILPLDKLLISQNDWLTSRLNEAAGAVNVKYNYEILRINNRY